MTLGNLTVQGALGNIVLVQDFLRAQSTIDPGSRPCPAENCRLRAFAAQRERALPAVRECECRNNPRVQTLNPTPPPHHSEGGRGLNTTEGGGGGNNPKSTTPQGDEGCFTTHVNNPTTHTAGRGRGKHNRRVRGGNHAGGGAGGRCCTI